MVDRTINQHYGVGSTGGCRWAAYNTAKSCRVGIILFASAGSTPGSAPSLQKGKRKAQSPSLGATKGVLVHGSVVGWGAQS